MVSGLTRLSASANRILPFIQSFVSKGLSANEALSSLIAAGQGIRRQDFLNAYTYVSGTQKAGFTISNVRKDYFPTVKTMPESLTNIRRDFSFNVLLDLKSHDTGQKFQKNITVTSDKLMRISDIEAEARDAFYSADADREDTNVEISGVTIVEARRRATIYYL